MHQEGQSIDLAALVLPEDTRVHFRAMSKSVGVFEPYLEVGAEVFILGFPWDLGRQEPSYLEAWINRDRAILRRLCPTVLFG
jgi:hypothetical protein